jgi:hypothetical protein
MERTKPSTMIGSRPLLGRETGGEDRRGRRKRPRYLVVRCPENPNTAPPMTSPAAMAMSAMVASAFLSSPSPPKKPTEVGKTPDQMES